MKRTVKLSEQHRLGLTLPVGSRRTDAARGTYLVWARLPFTSWRLKSEDA